MLSSPILTDFQKYLSLRQLANPKHIPFYAYWAARFFSFASANPDTDIEINIHQFLHNLTTGENRADWQIRQAHQAINLYIFQYLKQKDPDNQPPWLKANPSQPLTFQDLLLRMRDMIRVKHYASKTEKTYTLWAKRFYHYLTDVRNSAKPVSNLNSADVQDFLNYLALKRKVAASTQNQAFNALLFLFRDVMHRDLEGLHDTVRAKRGPRLPVVLAVEEVKALFSVLREKNLLTIQLIYGAGLRVSELVRIRVKDIDFSENLLYIRCSKETKTAPLCCRFICSQHCGYI